MRTIPIDSTDAREQRELEEEQARAEVSTPTAAADQHEEHGEHDPRCSAGWLGEDGAGKPVPCLRCRPHLAQLDDGRVVHQATITRRQLEAAD